MHLEGCPGECSGRCKSLPAPLPDVMLLGTWLAGWLVVTTWSWEGAEGLGLVHRDTEAGTGLHLC